jgi:hypothetical protein
MLHKPDISHVSDKPFQCSFTRQLSDPILKIDKALITATLIALIVSGHVFRLILQPLL